MYVCIASKQKFIKHTNENTQAKTYKQKHTNKNIQTNKQTNKQTKLKQTNENKHVYKLYKIE